MPSDSLITVCAIFKDERPYVLEWLAYYRSIGVRKFVVYSNDCTDGTAELLETLAAAGVLEHRAWPSLPDASPQITAYNDAVKRCSTKWILFVDADEFLQLPLDATIDEFLARFGADISAVAINWRVFGSSGHTVRSDEAVIERFTRASVRNHHLNRHCKTMAVAADVKEQHIHRSFLEQGKYVDTSGQEIAIERMGFTPSVKHETAQINHYVVKSKEEFEEKRRRGNANRAPGSVDKYNGRDGTYFANHDLNQEEDKAILFRIDSVKAEIILLQQLILQRAPRPD